MRIGILAERTGTSVPATRYYEQIGLLRAVARRGGQRSYDNEDLRRLSFIRRYRDFDFSLDEIRALLSLMGSGASCTEARRLAERHLVSLRGKLSELQALEKTISSLVEECATSCDGRAVSECVIVKGGEQA